MATEKSVVVHTRLPEDAKEHLEKLAEAHDRTISWLVKRMVMDALEHDKQWALPKKSVAKRRASSR